MRSAISDLQFAAVNNRLVNCKPIVYKSRWNLLYMHDGIVELFFFHSGDVFRYALCLYGRNVFFEGSGLNEYLYEVRKT